MRKSVLSFPCFPMILLPHGRPQAQPPLDHCARAGWESGRVKECVLEMRGVGTPVIIYRITYDDGEEVPCTQPPQLGPTELSPMHVHRWPRTCAHFRCGGFARRKSLRRTCSATSVAVTPLLHMVTASVPHGYSLFSIWLQHAALYAHREAVAASQGVG